MTPATHPYRRNEGIALLITLLFVVLLTALVVEFTYETQVQTSQVTANLNDFDAMIAARSAVNTGMSLLITDLMQNQVQKSGQGQQQSSGSRSTPQIPGLQYDSLDEPWAQGSPFQQINNAVTQCSISDEFGKLNLNALYVPRTKQEREFPILVLRALFEERGADPGAVDALLDWVDGDDESRPQGAESDYYQSLGIPYSCKNGPMSSVEELLMVRGVTPEVYFGDPTKDQLPLSELLTVYGQRSGRININTATHELLMAIGTALGQSGFAEAVEQERQSAPFTSAQDIQSRGIQIAPIQQTGGTGQAQQPFVVSSSEFRVQGNGMAGESRVRIEAFVHRDIQGGPDGFRLDSWKEIR